MSASRSGSTSPCLTLRLVAGKLAAILLGMVLPASALATTTAVDVDLATSVQASDIVLFGPPGCLPPPGSLGGPGPSTYSYGQTTVITSAAGNHVLEIVDLVTPPGAPADPVILLYQGGAFNPSAPADNLVLCDDNGNVDPSLSPAFSRIVVPASTTYTVVVLVPEDAGFAPGTSTATLSSALEPTITFANKSIALGAVGEFMTATSNSTGTISYAIQNPAVALIDPSTGELTTFSAGSTPVAALQARDGTTYGSGVKEATLTVTAASAPTVTGIVPTNGPTAGGTAVTITGTDFTGATSVTIGGAAATDVVVTNATTITATTPAGTAGARDVAVTTSGGTGTGTGLFTYDAPAATKLAFTTQPAGATAGAAFITQPVVTIQDAGGNTVNSSTATVTLAIKAATGTPGAVLQTCVPTAAVAGVATFTGCKIDLAGTGYVLTATATSLTSADSAAFGVAAVAPTVTAISPTNGSTAGGTAVTISGTNFTGATSVTIGGAAATGVVVTNATTITATTPAGTAGAKDVAVTTPGGTGTGTGLFTHNAPAATKLAFTTQPAGAMAGTAFTTQPVVAIQDADGNTFTAATDPVSLAIKPGTGTPGAVLTCIPKAAVAGVATFTGCNIDLAGTGYVLTASATGLTSAESAAFNVVAPPSLTAVNFSVSPTIAGSAAMMTVTFTAPTALVAGNTITAKLTGYTLTAGALTTTFYLPSAIPSSGSVSAGALDTVVVTLNAPMAAGAVAFQFPVTNPAAQTIAKAGLTVKTSENPTAVASANDIVLAAPVATKLAFVGTPPSTVTSGQRFSITVSAQNAAGIVDPNRAGVAVLTAQNASTLKGFLTANLINGQATFTGLYFLSSQPGTNTLTVSAPGLTSVTTPSINITLPTGASKIAFTSAPAFEVSGVAFSRSPVVKAFSADGSALTSFTGNVVLTVSPAPGTTTTPTLGGVTTVSTVAGAATFTGIRSTAPTGTYYMRATAGSLDASTTFNVYADATVAATARAAEGVKSKKFVLKFEVDEVVSTTSLASLIKADICEALGNPVSCARIMVKASRISSSDSASTKSASAAKDACPAVVTGVGEVTVPACQYGAPGTYRLEATSPGFPTTTSNLFTVVDTLVGNLPGAPRNLTVQTGDGQAVVSWDRPESTGAGRIVAYEVIGIRAGFPDQSLAKGLLTSKTLKLPNGSEWRFSVKAHNALGGGGTALSNLVQINAATPAPKVLGVPKLAVGGCTLQRSETIGVGPEEGPGTGAVMTYGATGLELTDCPGGVANVTLDYPVVVEDMQVYTLVDGRWSLLPPATPGRVLAGNSATFAVADNGPLDADPQVGVISVVAGVGDHTDTFISSFFSPSTAIPRLGNISTRGQVLTGNDVMIGGFVIGGSANKTVVVRARGPSLVPFGITNALANPQLQLVRSSDQQTLATNDDWGSAGNAAAITASGFAPDNVLESAILVSLAPGAYTAIVTGVGNTTGVGIVEVFEVDLPEAPLVNISTRGQVLTGNDVMIGGFIIQGDAPQTVVVRARGPSLVPFGITNALANPTLQLVRSSDQATIAVNDDWGGAGNAAAITASGFAPDNALESAILITLDPGAYTAIVTGAGGTTGVAIIEVFAQ